LKAEREELKSLRDTGSITIDDLRRRKTALFLAQMQRQNRDYSSQIYLFLMRDYISPKK
jgi:hypothetical protein